VCVLPDTQITLQLRLGGDGAKSAETNQIITIKKQNALNNKTAETNQTITGLSVTGKRTEFKFQTYNI
jgi:hypothetical protein